MKQREVGVAERWNYIYSEYTKIIISLAVFLSFCLLVHFKTHISDTKLARHIKYSVKMSFYGTHIKFSFPFPYFNF